jgi:hypothetical protein
MRWHWFILLIISIALAACGMVEVQGQILNPSESVSSQTAAVQPPTEAPTSAPTDTPAPPQLSFEAVTYQDKEAGFAFEYPSDWGIGYTENQSRGKIVQLQDASGPRLDIVVLLWDPKHDLPAFVEVRKIAWESSGITIQQEGSVTLTSGQEAEYYIVEGQDGDQGFFFFSTLGDRYLQLSGNDDVALMEEIAGTVRLFEPSEPVSESTETVVAGEPFDCFKVSDQSENWVPCNVIDGIRSRNLYALHGYMANPFVIVYWGSESRSDTPKGITEELQSYRLPQDPYAPMTFTADRDAFPPLAGTPVEDLLGPDVNPVLVLYSEGWGTDGLGAALLYFAQNTQGKLYWYALVISGTHFDK